MDKIIPFIVKHWMLVGAFIIVFILLILEEMKNKGMGGSHLTPEKATRLINSEEAVVVDIRESSVYNLGHVINSINIPLADFERGLKRLQKYKQKPVIVVDATGQKSVHTVSKLKKAGFEKAVVLRGGLASWKNANMPLVKK